ncbi:SDR family NAD(P)-dependent oxidoreductase [Saccharibacillus sacchari]|uniref:SDR family NAD(P)-dependent oxidoreductase n=1 Tax=Saccharibacillus sacchari TaxID=456493 RepID=UPI0004B94991|nr:SDR family NAD(P)-dependent oxidoreductase [Saccharibacillus sacchari]
MSERIAIVTGSASGIGRELAKQLESGRLKGQLDEVWIVDKNRAGLESLQAELPIQARLLEMDLSERSSIQQLTELLRERQPDVRLLANCAGYGKFARIGEVPAEQELGMIRLNCEALTAVTTATLPYMQAGGRIINIASSAAHFPIPGFGIYSATKSYVLYFSRILGKELKSRGIGVTVLCPGPVDTGFFEVAESHGGFNIMQKLPRTTPQDEAKHALRSSEQGKAVATLGAVATVARLCGRLFPQALMMNAFWKLK